MVGRRELVNAINVARAPGTASFFHNDPRLNEDLTIRPRDAEIVIRAGPGAPFGPETACPGR
ncbi:MAG: hypothetical protein RQ751_03975 [Longimicrobiales bacterium]|nr:hypothetical protein [Longimicrobiales bacterium]